jgi:hypothetical protein
MAEKYRVLRRHVGDERTAEAAEVKHLVDQGVLQPIRAKAEAPAKNKAEPAPKNKGA